MTFYKQTLKEILR